MNRKELRYTPEESVNQHDICGQDIIINKILCQPGFQGMTTVICVILVDDGRQYD